MEHFLLRFRCSNQSALSYTHDLSKVLPYVGLGSPPFIQ